jgi:hypothetical protein
LFGSDPDPEVGQVATHAGRQLYTYLADSGPALTPARESTQTAPSVVIRQSSGST